ncbi:MAG: ABC transporter substrate-binding protein [Sarcina sp.]
MSKKIKLLVLGMAVMATASFVACGANEKKPEDANKVGQEEVKSLYSYTYDDGTSKVDVNVTKAPQRAVTLSQFMTEMLLALDLGDRMVGTALLDNEILPEFKEAYDKIPELEIGEGHSISKEGFVALEPDFVSGWEMSVSDETTGSPEDLVKDDIYPFVLKSLAGTATVETVYEDFEALGKMFAVEDKAVQVISNMKAEIAKVQENLEKTEGEKPRVLIYDSGEKDAMVVGAGLPNNLIELAGGNNIYGDLKNAYETVSFESIVEKNPEVILVTEFLVGDKAEDKIKFLKSHPGLKDVDAIKNDKIFVVELADLSPGIRSSKAIVEMHEYFYGK